MYVTLVFVGVNIIILGAVTVLVVRWANNKNEELAEYKRLVNLNSREVEHLRRMQSLHENYQDAVSKSLYNVTELGAKHALGNLYILALKEHKPELLRNAILNWNSKHRILNGPRD